MNGVVVASNTSPRSLFSIQIQITWSYNGGAVPGRPHGPTHSIGAVADAVVDVVADVVSAGEPGTEVLAGPDPTESPPLVAQAVSRTAASTAIGVGVTEASFASAAPRRGIGYRLMAPET